MRYITIYYNISLIVIVYGTAVQIFYLHIFHNSVCKPVEVISDFLHCIIRVWCYNLLADQLRGTFCVSSAPTTCTLVIWLVPPNQTNHNFSFLVTEIKIIQ